ncbi:MAG: PQQ-dependent sugar dehydrogenase [Pseudomonadota bacterium]|nr:PQQ-dependent sugar dehydrogenase [Pseudomonadota bacterium]
MAPPRIAGQRGFALALFLLMSIAADAQIAPPDLTLQTVVMGLSEPLSIRNAGDGSNRLFIAGRRGRISVLLPGASAPLVTPFLNLPQCGATPVPHCVRTDYENGLLGLAFHPQYAANGYVYINYNDLNDDTVIARLQVSAGDTNQLDVTTITTVLRIDLGYRFHRGGDLAFGPDGYLYIPMGDGSDQGDPCRRGQTLTPAQLMSNDSRSGDCPSDSNFTGIDANPDSRALLSKVIRIDVDQVTAAGENELCADNSDGSALYAIPASNPHAGGNGVAGACDETLSHGWRNPFRFSIDRVTGEMFLGDVGWSAQEEISLDRIDAIGTRDYGWSNCEGTNPIHGTCATSVAPIFSYARNTGHGSSVTGGYVYRGAISALQGVYIFGDFTSGRVFFLLRPTPPATTWNFSLWQDTPALIAGFGEDENGELYLVDFQGKVLRFHSSQVEVPFANSFEQ